MVWQRINHPINRDHYDDLKLSLTEQLADCKPTGNIGIGTGIVCVVGRISRILQTLELLDAENIVTLNPKWAVNDSISNYCTRYIGKLTKLVPNEYRVALDTLNRTPEQEIMSGRFYACIKHNLDRKFTKLYVDTGLLTVDELSKLTAVPYEQLV